MSSPATLGLPRWAAVAIALALTFAATCIPALAATLLRLMRATRLDPRLEQLATRYRPIVVMPDNARAAVASNNACR